MKQLQNNFTTVEQSKRLLELGVPVNSADCYFGSYPGHPDWVVIRQSEFAIEDDALFRLNEDITPCWSVGRLIEILHITYKQDWREYLYLCTTETCNKGLINQIMLYLENHSKDHDFSKLEE